MGIYDREYYRSDSERRFGMMSTDHRGCKVIIAINVIIFIIQAFTLVRDPIFGMVIEEGWFTDLFMLQSDAVLKSGEVWRLLSYAFLHDTRGLLHLLINMIVLWWFGSVIEDMIGTREFIAFYLLAAILSGTGQILATLAGLSAGQTSVVGASGAVNSILLMYAYHYPRKTLLLFFVLPVPMWLFATFYVAMDTLGLIGIGKDRVAHSVHLAGAAFGLLYASQAWKLTSWLGRSSNRRSRETASPRLRIYRDPVPTPPRSEPSEPIPAPEIDENLDAKLDRVLEKVAREGQSSLTKAELDILTQASERLRKKRK